MRTTLVLLVFVAMAALASKVDAKTWEEDDMIIVEGKFGRRSVIQLVHVGESPILARSRVATRPGICKWSTYRTYYNAHKLGRPRGFGGGHRFEGPGRDMSVG